MVKRIVVPPYDNYDLSTFVIKNDTVYIGHFGGCCDNDGNLLTTVEQQMEKTLQNLANSLAQIDMSLSNIVKLTVILRNIKDFQGMHRIWTKYFSENNYPVRTVISSEFVSENCLVQVEGIACY